MIELGAPNHIAFREPTHLLPATSTSLEIALDLAERQVLDIPVPLRDLWNPETCPAHLLDYLAWGLGVDLWDEAWSEGRKRRMCREIWQLKRLKGRLPGVKGYLSFVDAEIVAARLPPQKIFARAYDPKRREAFLERFAQLRVYPFRHREDAPGLQGYAGGATMHAGGFSSFARSNTAAQRYGRRATIWDKGEELDVRWSLQTAQRDRSSQEATPVERIVVPARMAPSEAIVGRAFVGRVFASSSRPRSRILTIDPVRQTSLSGGSSISQVVEGLALVQKKPDRVRGRGPTPAKAMRVNAFVGGFVSRNDAALRLYDRYHLLDEDRVPRQTAAGLGPFIGSMRVGIDPFCAHLRISRPDRERGRTMYVGGFVGDVLRQPAGRFNVIAKALRASSVYRDTIKFSTRCHEPLGFVHAPAFADTPQFGAITKIKRAA